LTQVLAFADWLWPPERLAAARAVVGLAAGDAVGEAVEPGCGEVAVVEVGWAEAARALPVLGPAVVRWPGCGGAGLAVSPGGWGRVVVATPAGRRRTVRAKQLAGALAEGALRMRAGAWERLAARLPPRRGRRRGMEKALRAAVLASCAPLLVEVQGGERAERRTAGWGGAAGALAVAATLERVVAAGGWYLLGRSVLEGRTDRGWLVGWSLVVLTLPVLRWVELVAGAQLSERVAVGGRLQRFARLLAQAPRGWRRKGLGWWVGGLFGAEAVDGVVASAATLAVSAVAELLVGGVTVVASAGRVQMVLLAGMLAGVAVAGSGLVRVQTAVERVRRSLTEGAVEVFGRTASGGARADGAAQGGASEDLDLEDSDEYQRLCRRAGRWERWLRVGLPRVWLLASVGALAVTGMLGHGEPRWVAAAVAGAWWVRVGLVELGAALVQGGGAWGAERAAAWGGRGRRRREGRARLGEARCSMVVVPREPYVFAESLGFNLLLGRGWPAAEGDLAAAAAVCRELGLMAAVERMPSGLRERVGEGGWRLSASEACRVCVARALLHGAEAVVIREGCLAVLDAAEREQVLAAVARRAPGVRVVAEEEE
jgi:hypothetical protein